MSSLTIAQKKTFATDMPGILRSNATAFTGLDFDPAARATAIETLLSPLPGLTGDRSNKEQVYHAAVAAENAAIDSAYEEASRAVKGVEGVLPASHPLLKELKNKRDLMSNEAARGPKKKPAA